MSQTRSEAPPTRALRSIRDDRPIDRQTFTRTAGVYRRA
jgi:hypothetical protein